MDLTNAKLYNKIATYIAFFIVGSSIALWAISIPYIKIRLNIEELSLGTILMFLSIGAIVAMMITDKLVSKIGCRFSFLISVLLLTISLLFVNIAPNRQILTVLVTIMGIGAGIADVTANIQAVYMEKAFEKKLMSSFHSLYSLGSFITGMAASFILSLQFSIYMVVNGFVVLFLVLLIFIIGGIVPFGNFENTMQNKKFKFPSLLLIIAGFICFTAYMTEGAMLDWASILLIDHKSFIKENAGYGFSIFFATVTIGRLAGDFLANKYDAAIIITCSALITLCGISIILISDTTLILYTAFAITGFGAANIIPMTISTIPKIKGNMSLNTAIALVTTIGYSGSLLGPALIGYISHLTSLITAFVFICILLFLVSAFSLKIKGK